MTMSFASPTVDRRQVRVSAGLTRFLQKGYGLLPDLQQPESHATSLQSI
jgi:hypothetical protein